MDVESQSLREYFEEGIAFIEAGLEKGGVLVHCQGGVSRSSSFVIAWLMKSKGLGFGEALVYVQSKRKCVWPNDGFR
jgi:protein-tyrosine phosphatase